MARRHRIRKKSRALTVSDAKPLGRARSRTGVMHRGAFFCPCDPRGRFRIRCLFAIRCPIGCPRALPLSGGWRSGGTSACPMAEEGFRAAGELSRDGPTRLAILLRAHPSLAKKTLSRKRHRLRGNASVLTKQRGRMQVASGRTLQPFEQDAAYASAMPRLKSMIF